MSPSAAELRHLRVLARAALAGRVARVRWHEAGSRSVACTVNVLSLAFDGTRWLAATWASDRGALRLVPLDRFLRVRVGRARAGAPPDGFDPLDFALHRFLDPAAGDPRSVTVWLDDRFADLASVLVPTATAEPALFGGARCHVRATRPGVVVALATSLRSSAALHSAHMPTPTPSRQPPGTAEARLLRLAAWLLSQDEPVSWTRIVETFPDDYRGNRDAIEKKLTRDKNALRRLGYAVDTVQLGSRADAVGYVIDARACSLPRIELGPDEAAAVWTAGVAALRFSDHPLAEELESALRKLLVGARGFPPRVAAAEELRDAPARAAEAKLLEKLVGAWERRKRVTVGYWRVAENAVVQRDVDVYGWASRRGEWIFAGHDHLRKAVRVFYLSRVRALKVNAVRAQDPDYVIPADFDIRRWSRQQVWDYDVHAPVGAVVRFRGSLARLAKQLLPSATVTTDEAGFRVARLEVRNLRGLARQALAWGPEAELVAPPEGRGMAREILAAVGGGAGGRGRGRGQKEGTP